jgi:Ohr subfamily peroxiredoxin
MPFEKILDTAQAKVTGGREGRAVSADGILDVKLTTPKELGGAGNPGTNPEQLFADGYSDCFIGALRLVAGRDNITLPQDVSIEGSVGIGPVPTALASLRS